MTLRWSAPPMLKPTVVGLGTGHQKIDLGPDEDCILVWPTKPRTGVLEVSGGHNVIMSGGVAIGEGVMRVRGLTGWMWAHALELCTQTMEPKDVLNVSGPGAGPTVCLQQVRLAGAWGSQDTVHGDDFQAQGSLRNFYADRLSCQSYYQCLSFAGDGLVSGSIRLFHTDMTVQGENAGYALWMPRGIPIHLQDVYATSEGHPKQPSAWPKEGRVVDDYNVATWPDTRIRGRVYGPREGVNQPVFVRSVLP